MGDLSEDEGETSDRTDLEVSGEALGKVLGQLLRRYIYLTLLWLPGGTNITIRNIIRIKMYPCRITDSSHNHFIMNYHQQKSRFHEDRGKCTVVRKRS